MNCLCVIFDVFKLKAMLFSTNTKAFKSISLILACSILLVSCYTTQYIPLQDEYNARFNGKTYTEIVELVGPPDRIVPDGQGGEIMVYENKSLNGEYEGIATGGITSGSINLSESKKQTSFFVDENKVCYKVKTNDVRAEEKFTVIKALDVFAVILVGFIFVGPIVYVLTAESD